MLTTTDKNLLKDISNKCTTRDAIKGCCRRTHSRNFIKVLRIGRVPPINSLTSYGVCCFTDRPLPTSGNIFLCNHFRHHQGITGAIRNAGKRFPKLKSKRCSPKSNSCHGSLTIVGIAPINRIITTYPCPSINSPFIFLKPIRRAAMGFDFCLPSAVVLGIAVRCVEIEHLIPGFLLDIRPNRYIPSIIIIPTTRARNRICAPVVLCTKWK